MRPEARTWTWIAAAHCLLLALPCACGSSAGNHPDADASGGAGGQQVVDGSMDQIADGPGSNGDAPADQGSATDAGADAGGPGSGACLGACVESLLAQCPRAGMNCVSSTSTIDISHYTTTTCYANGVERQLVMAGTSTMTTVKKANGEICYTATTDSAAATGDFFDAAGNSVAHLVFGNPLTSVTVTCTGGAVTHGDLSLPACADFTSGTSACAQGACTW